MFSLGSYAYNYQHNRLLVNGESMIFHCHHYNTFLQRSIRDAEYIDSQPFLIGAAAEVAYLQLSDLLAGIPALAEKKAAIQELYRLCGFGLINLEPITEQGGTVRTRSTHYSMGWKEKFGASTHPVAFFTAGFLAGAFAALYGKELKNVHAEQVACMSMGASEDVFVVRSAAANFAVYGPKQAPVFVPVGEVAEPATGVDRKGIVQALTAMPILGNEQGLIPAFGVYLTRMYVDYYNRISFEFEKAMIAAAGAPGIEVSSGLFIEAGHVCAFNTFGGIMTSPEWDALILPSLKTREDWVYAMTSAVNALGWGVWKVIKVSPEGATFRIYNDYESLGYNRMCGQADHGIAYLSTGAAAGIMNLIYLGDIASKPALNEAFYNKLFKGKGVFRAAMKQCQAQGHLCTEIEVFKV